MSDLPDRIWCWKSPQGLIHVANLLPIQATDTEYLKADTLPSREELAELIEEEHYLTYTTACNIADDVLARIKGAYHE